MSTARSLAAPLTLGVILVAGASLAPIQQLPLRLGDTDDAMRLQSVRDLLAGQAWSDLVQHRMAGLEMHWSRLVDSPLAAMMALLAPLLGPENAELAVRAIWPPLLFVVALAALLRVAFHFGGARAAWAVAVMAPLSVDVWEQFAPGRIDHHNVQITLAALMLAAATNLRETRNAALIGALAALSAAVGLESIGVIAWTALIYFALLVLQPEHARAARAYGLAFAGVGALAYVVQTPPAWLMRTACDALQFNGVAGVILAGGGLALLSLRPGATLTTRALSAGAVLLAAGAIALALHPSCLHGPYADIDERIKTIWLPYVAEAKSWSALVQTQPGEAISTILLPLATFAYAAWTIRKGEREPAFLANAALLAVTLAIGFIQVRGLALACLAALPLAAHGLARVQMLGKMRPMLAGLLAGATASLTIFYGGELFARPAVASTGDDYRACKALSAFEDLRRQPRGLVFAELNADAHILAATQHAVAGGPYHRLGQEIFEAVTAFSGTTENAAQIVQRTGADYVAICRTGAAARTAGPGSFGRLLLDGAPPAWLTPISAPGEAYAAFRVDKALLAQR